MQKLSVFFILIVMAFNAQAQNRTKDGRQYLSELKTRLEIEDKDEMNRLFLSLRTNLPKNNSANSMATSLDAVAKLAAGACTISGYFYDQGWDDLDALYKALLDRAPTEEERRKALRNADGTLSYFANCFFLAMHPEFVTQK